MRPTSLIVLLALSGCYAEWDVPRTPRRDPCTQQRQNSYVYIDPACPNPPPRNPRDMDDGRVYDHYYNR
jgi:hypothetical protein